MDDVIYRQVLRDAMYHEAFEVDSDLQKWDGGCWIRYKMFENVVDKIPSAQQWIPCAERMPEEYVSVLCNQPIYDGKNIWIGYLNSDGIWVDSDGWEKLTSPVTAWMPLPEPYKEESTCGK